MPSEERRAPHPSEVARKESSAPLPGFSAEQQETFKSFRMDYSQSQHESLAGSSQSDVPEVQGVTAFLQLSPNEQATFSPLSLRRAQEHLEDLEIDRLRFAKWHQQVEIGADISPERTKNMEYLEGSADTRETIEAITELVNNERTNYAEQKEVFSEHPWENIGKTMKNLKREIANSAEKIWDDSETASIVLNDVLITHHKVDNEIEIVREEYVDRWGSEAVSSETFLWSEADGLVYVASYFNPETKAVETTDDGKVTKESLDDKGKHALERFYALIDSLSQPLAA